MTPMEALKLLDGVCSQVQTNRENHTKLQEAIMVLHQAINPKPVAASEAE